MATVERIMLLAGALALASCDTRGGWYPQMDCQQRDLKSGLCIEARYSCKIEQQMLAYYVDGPRCYRKGP